MFVLLERSLLNKSPWRFIDISSADIYYAKITQEVSRSHEAALNENSLVIICSLYDCADLSIVCMPISEFTV